MKDSQRNSEQDTRAHSLWECVVHFFCFFFDIFFCFFFWHFFCFFWHFFVFWEFFFAPRCFSDAENGGGGLEHAKKNNLSLFTLFPCAKDNLYYINCVLIDANKKSPSYDPETSVYYLLLRQVFPEDIALYIDAFIPGRELCKENFRLQSFK